MGWALAAGVAAGLSGALGGWRRVYRWRHPSGWLAFVLDSSWALLTTLGSLVAHAVALAQRGHGNFRPELSERRNRHVYARGYRLRRGFLLTIGNVVNGASGRGGGTTRIVDEHEDVHVWQARWFGPLFPLLYGSWMVVGAVLGALSWVRHRGRGRIGASIEAWAYYRNPFEWWAYSRERRWPPPRVDPAAVWSRPLASPHRAGRAG